MPLEHLPGAIERALEETAAELAGRPRLARMFAQCFPNTLETTTELLEDGTTYVFTGDIPAMWLRDSSAQLRPYVSLAAGDGELQRLLEGAIRRQIRYIHIDPYANAFNREANGRCWAEDLTERNPWVWERKYEIDSLCYPILLGHMLWKASGSTAVFDGEFARAARRIVELWRVEQNHGEDSTYSFERTDCPPSDTLTNGGRGTEVARTGMTWSGFRPSDDACQYGYLVPSNMFAVVALRHLSEIARAVLRDEALAGDADQLGAQIDAAIREHAVIDHADFGPVYAYEVDGLGGVNFMDDANVPSLLSAPYLGYCRADDPVYANTRRLLLSPHNPYYYEGACARGIGSPHTPERYVWPISLCMQGLTSADQAEMDEIVDTLERTDGGTGYMHEGFNVDDPSQFTREWFAWANSLFGEFIMHWCRQRRGGA